MEVNKIVPLKHGGTETDEGNETKSGWTDFGALRRLDGEFILRPFQLLKTNVRQALSPTS